MKLYNADASPNALRTRAVAFELGLEPEIVNIDLRKGENRTPDYLALNPNGKVPTLVNGDLVIWESRAINAYLAAQNPAKGLYPSAPKRRAEIDQWLWWQAIQLGPAMQKIAFERVMKKAFGRGGPDEDALVGDLRTVADLLPILERALAGKHWIADDLSLADFALASTFMMRKPARLGIEAYPNITAWIERLEGRQSWKRAIAPWKETVAAVGIVVE